MFDNIITLTDSYKVSHAVQYPPNTSKVYSYFESRGGEFKETVFFGLQYFLKRYLEGCVVTLEHIVNAKKFLNAHLGPGRFQEDRWQYILEKHGGKLPVKIRAVPEGTVVPTRNVLMTIENTDPECFWLTNYLETLLVQVWYPSTTATVSREMKKLLNASLIKTGDPSGLAFKLHDFGFRGVSSVESAGLGGAGHLVNFQGTDTMAALEVCARIYEEPMAGYSIPAAEHSTITSWGREGETAAYKNMLEQFPTGLVAVVSDSWDIFNACKHIWGEKLKEQVLARKDGFLVIRPDSGDPRVVLPQLLNTLSTRFECYTNDKGYRVLPNQVRLIQGDGIRRDTLGEILDAVNNAGWSTDNLAFGSGGGLLQDCNRDTSEYAFKCSYMEQDGQGHDIYKQPVGAAWKKSKKGRLDLWRSPVFEPVNGTEYGTLQEGQYLGSGFKVLQTVFEDGYCQNTTTLAEVRKRAAL
jgi:nicotinamide phosphoribosyltransferase